MDAWEGMAMDSIKFHPDPTCPTLLRPAGGPPLKRPYDHFRGGLPAGRVACGHLLPLWTPHAVRLCFHFPLVLLFFRLNKVVGVFHRRTAWGIQVSSKTAAGHPPCGGHLQGVEGQGMVGPSDTLVSPWVPLAIRPRVFRPKIST
jgi:hypothetical protein